MSDSKSKSLKLIAVGDLAFNGAYHRLLPRYGADYPFRQLLPIWKPKDLLLGNLESPISNQPRVAPAKLTLRGNPLAIEALKVANFDCVSLANNHMMDFGVEGLLETCACLDQAGIAHVGAGRNLQEATAPVVLERNGYKIGVLACCDVIQISRLYADEHTAGVAPADLDRCLSIVRSLRDHVDWVVLQIHWGQEMSELPAPKQRRWARELAQAGVDVVLGHHPHIVQPIEYISGVPVAYSLGDFTFSDTYWHGVNGKKEPFLASFQVHPMSRKTGWLEVVLDSKLTTQITYRPAKLNRGLVVCPDETLTRHREMDALASRLSVNGYDQTFDAEQQLALARDAQRCDWRRPIKRTALKLLKWGLLPGAYVEPDGTDWRSSFSSRD